MSSCQSWGAQRIAVSRLKVLLTCETFNLRGGASLYVRDVALELQRKGHRPVVFSPELGELAAELRQATIPVVSRLEDLAEEPDVIHGQHHLTAMKAMLHFSHTPGIFICHGWTDTPIRFPRIFQYVAVDEVCYDQLVSQNGIEPERVKLILNFADLKRFKPRPRLPQQPKRALIFSNTISGIQGLEAIREACARAGLEVDALGYGTGNASANPEHVLPDYDIVFAKARCAIEALAVGCAVVTCDVGGLADMVSTENYEELRRLNFGRRSLVNPLDPTMIFDAIRRYSATDAEQVVKKIRSTAGLDAAVSQLVSLYEDVIKEHRKSRPDPSVELRAAAAYLGELSLPDVTSSSAGAGRALERPVSMPTVLADEMILTPVGELPLDALEAITGEIAARANLEPEHLEVPAGSVLLKTAPLPWHYAAILPMPAELAPEVAPRAGVIRVRVLVHKGSAGHWRA